jgi:hypothetical protein
MPIAAKRMNTPDSEQVSAANLGDTHYVLLPKPSGSAVADLSSFKAAQLWAVLTAIVK